MKLQWKKISALQYEANPRDDLQIVLRDEITISGQALFGAFQVYFVVDGKRYLHKRISLGYDFGILAAKKRVVAWLERNQEPLMAALAAKIELERNRHPHEKELARLHDQRAVIAMSLAREEAKFAEAMAFYAVEDRRAKDGKRVKYVPTGRTLTREETVYVGSRMEHCSWSQESYRVPIYAQEKVDYPELTAVPDHPDKPTNVSIVDLRNQLVLLDAEITKLK